MLVGKLSDSGTRVLDSSCDVPLGVEIFKHGINRLQPFYRLTIDVSLPFLEVDFQPFSTEFVPLIQFPKDIISRFHVNFSSSEWVHWNNDLDYSNVPTPLRVGNGRLIFVSTI